MHQMEGVISQVLNAFSFIIGCWMYAIARTLLTSSFYNMQYNTCKQFFLDCNLDKQNMLMKEIV